MRRSLVLLLGCSLALAACQKSSDSSSREKAAPKKSRVDLAALKSDGGCLNLEKSFAEIATLDQGLSVLQVTTKMTTNSKKQVRDRFVRSLAYANFLYAEKPLSELTDFPPVRQTDCSSVTFVNPDDNNNDEYKIVESSPDSLVLKNEDGRRLRYHWISPESLEIENQFTAYDVPCGDMTPVTVGLTKVLDWSWQRTEAINEKDSPLRIDPDLLSHLAEAVGRPSSELYSTADAGLEGTVQPDKLREFALSQPVEDLKTCNLPVRDPNAPDDDSSTTPTDPSTDPGTVTDPAPANPTPPDSEVNPAPAPSEPPEENTDEPIFPWDNW